MSESDFRDSRLLRSQPRTVLVGTLAARLRADAGQKNPHPFYSDMAEALVELCDRAADLSPGDLVDSALELRDELEVSMQTEFRSIDFERAVEQQVQPDMTRGRQPDSGRARTREPKERDFGRGD